MADNYYAMGKKKESKKALEKSLKVRENFYALVGLAYIVFDKGEFGESAEFYKRAIALKPDNITAHFNLGNAYLNGGAYELAAKEFKWVIARAPEIKEADTLLRMSLKNIGSEGRKVK